MNFKNRLEKLFDSDYLDEMEKKVRIKEQKIKELSEEKNTGGHPGSCGSGSGAWISTHNGSFFP